MMKARILEAPKKARECRLSKGTEKIQSRATRWIFSYIHGITRVSKNELRKGQKTARKLAAEIFESFSGKRQFKYTADGARIKLHDIVSSEMEPMFSSMQTCR